MKSNLDTAILPALPVVGLSAPGECHHSGFSIGRRQRSDNGVLMGFKRVAFHNHSGKTPVLNAHPAKALAGGLAVITPGKGQTACNPPVTARETAMVQKVWNLQNAIFGPVVKLVWLAVVRVPGLALVNLTLENTAI